VEQNMAGDSQGVRSSRTEPIHARDRRKMRLLDRKISRLDYAIWINEVWNKPLADKQRAERAKHDASRKWLRNWMKQGK